MKKAIEVLVAAGMAIIVTELTAAPVSGEVSRFESPNGLEELCIQIEPIPGAHLSRHDRKTEAEYCKLDLHELALCPKLWSTSPGTIIYEVESDVLEFERRHCAEGHHAREVAKSKPATFKVSVNARDTSATYAPSSWVYYNFSRYFRSNVHVPVAVYRSFDARVHNQRVVKPALKITANRSSVRMLAAGWRVLDEIESGAITGSAAHAALTDEGRQVFGVLIDNKGDRYGAEFNGTRESGWGAGQNNDFQQTAPFLALRSDLPVNEAATQAIHDARRNPRMAKALPADIPVVQVVIWMQDVLEITLLDYILSQQDRIGNIDYNWRWYWIEDGKLESRSAHEKTPPDEIAGFNPVRLRQSAINDNDAGVRQGYADFAKRTHMLEDLRHYSPSLYVRLAKLATDFEAKGPAYRWMTEIAGLSTREADGIAARTAEAFALLKNDCQSGTLKLDLDPSDFLATASGRAPKTNVGCEPQGSEGR
jgi:hypothetical protein